MNQKLMICFDLGYKVEDKTGFRDSLTDLYIEDKVLMLDMKSSDSGVEITFEEIDTLHKELKEEGIIRTDKNWYLKKQPVCDWR